MRIVRLISYLNVGGVEKRMFFVLRELKKMGHEVSVVCIHSEGRLAPLFRREGIPVYVVPFRSRLDPLGIARLVGLFKKLKPDVVHAHMYRPGVVATISAKIFGARLVYNIHNIEQWDTKRQILLDRLLNPLRDTVVCVSRAVASDFMRKTGFFSPRIRIVYNGVSADRKCGKKERERFLFLTACRLVPQKRVDRAVELFLRLRKKWANLTLEVAGSGPLLELLKSKYGRQPGVLFLGQRKDVEKLMHRSHFSLLLSEKEGFANVVLEAMSGCTVPIVSGVGGNPEAVEHLKTGVLKAHERCAVRLVEIPALLKKLSVRAKRRQKRFSLKEMLRNTLKLYLTFS